MEKWETFKWIGEEYNAGVLIVVDRDIIDYFTDIARATDDREMGGFLLGDYVYYEESIRLWLIVHFHDYVQVPNVSEEPTKSFRWPKESLYEVGDMISAGRYNAFTLLHTHPSDSYFSAADLHVQYRFSTLISDAVPEEARRFQCFIPHFIVTGGRIGYTISYMNYPHHVCYYTERRFSVAFSKSLSGTRQLNILYRNAKLKYPEDYEFHISIPNTEYTILKIFELEDILATWERWKRAKRERIVEEMKERVRREIERRLKQL